MKLNDKLEFSERGNALVGQRMFEILEQANQLEAEGHKVFHLELGDPKYPAPQEVIEKTIKALEDNEVGYCSSFGVKQLREEIATYYAKAFNYDLSFKQVAISPANLLITQLLEITCNQKDNVVFFTPAFPTYLASAKYINLNICQIPLSENQRFLLTKKSVDEAMSYQPKAIIVNSGNNPTGAVYSKEILAYLLAECKKNNCWLISDETYWKVAYGDSYYSLAGNNYSKLAIISSLSKVFSLPAYRIGYAIADERVIDKLSLSTSTLYSCLPKFTQLGVISIFKNIDTYSDKIKSHYKRIIIKCIGMIDESAHLHCIMPNSAFYLFISIKNSGMNDVEYAETLLQNQKVAVTPGSSFAYDDYIRLSLCGDEEDVIEGVRRLIQFSNSINK